jgi:DNA polymerase-3 subunit gamma/tau
MAVLYRKHRPQTFAEVFNQKYIVQALKNQAALGEPAHAYLFTGSRGVGKTSVARILAKAVNCLQRTGEGDACGVCESCKQITEGRFLDLLEIDAASNTGVDNIRELIEHIRFAPSSGKYKVFIIDEVHMLSKGAFNALLKTLEEPPKHAIFILATTEISKVPATIVSRTQRFDFKALSKKDLEEHLTSVVQKEGLVLDLAAIALVAENAQGSVRDALSLLDKILTLGDNPSLEECRQLLGFVDIKVSENLLELIETGQAKSLSGFYEELVEKGQDFLVFSRDFLEYLRKILNVKLTSNATSLDEEHGQKALEFAEKFSQGELMFIIRLFLRAYKELYDAPNPELPMLLASVEAALKRAGGGNGGSAITNNNNRNENTTQPSIKSVSQEALVVEIPKVAVAEEVVQLGQDVVISREEVESFWPKFISELKKLNSPLANMVRSCQLLEINDGKIFLGSKFAFHKQNLENQKNKQMIHQVLERVSGVKLGVFIRVEKIEETSQATSPTEALAGALQIFGGELVE